MYPSMLAYSFIYWKMIISWEKFRSSRCRPPSGERKNLNWLLQNTITKKSCLKKKISYMLHICELTCIERVSPEFQRTYPQNFFSRYHPHSYKVTRLNCLSQVWVCQRVCQHQWVHMSPISESLRRNEITQGFEASTIKTYWHIVFK